MLSISEKDTGSVYVCCLEGRLDGQTSPEATERLNTAMGTAGTKPMVLDLSHLEYLSSAGLRVILVAAKTAKAGGSQLALSSPTTSVKEVLDISGFAAVLPIHATLEEASQDLS